MIFIFSATVAHADNIFTDFELFNLGTSNGQEGWTVNSTVDQEIVDQYIQPASTSANRSLRISYGKPSSGGFVMSKPLINEAGETGASNGILSSGIRQPHFEAEWDFASADPNYAYQQSLNLIASAERGGDAYDDYSMGEIFMADCPGITLDNPQGICSNAAGNFFNIPGGLAVIYWGDPSPWNKEVLASGLNRTQTHRIKLTMDFVDGSANDAVSVCVDSFCYAKRSLEELNRVHGIPTQVVRAINFRQPSGSVPATLGKGFFIDNFSILSSGNTPGCTDPAAINYNSEANSDDGSCKYSVPGCTDPAAINYKPEATEDDGSCILPLYGCMDPAAINYNKDANTDDGSCILPVPPPTDTGDCKRDRWMSYNNPSFKNQGQCVKYVQWHKIKRFERIWEKWKDFRDRYEDIYR